MKKTIKKEQRLQLIGLGVLATHASQRLTDLAQAVATIVEGSPDGHADDFVYDHHDTDRLLRSLGITVVDGKQEQTNG